MRSVLKGYKRAIGAILLMGAAFSSVNAYAEELKIGFVNTERILRDSKFAVQSQKDLEASFAKRQKELEGTAAKVRAEAVKLDKDAITLSETEKVRRQRDLAEMDRDFQRKRREFDEDLAQRKSQLVGELVERANKVIRELAESQNFDLILQEAVHVSKRIDITDQVLQKLNGQSK